MKEKNIVNPAFDWEGDSEFGSFDRRDFLKVLGGGVVVTSPSGSPWPSVAVGGIRRILTRTCA